MVRQTQIGCSVGTESNAGGAIHGSRGFLCNTDWAPAASGQRVRFSARSLPGGRVRKSLVTACLRSLSACSMLSGTSSLLAHGRRRCLRRRANKQGCLCLGTRQSVALVMSNTFMTSSASSLVTLTGILPVSGGVRGGSRWCTAPRAARRRASPPADGSGACDAGRDGRQRFAVRLARLEMGWCDAQSAQLAQRPEPGDQ